MWLFKRKKRNIEEISEIVNKKFRVKRYIGLLIGIVLISISFNVFMLPNNIVFGGVSGLSIITKKFLNIEPATFIMIASIMLLIVSYFVMGKEKTAGSVTGSLLFPIFVKLTSDLPQYLNIDYNDVLLCAIFGGAIYGVGAGLVFKSGFTTGGTDIINQITSKYLKISMGKSLIICDGLIVLTGVFAFGVTKLMYALIVLYIISILTDKVLLGISDSKAFYIIAEKDIEIKDYILNSLNHGVTIFDAKGGFKNSRQKVLFCVIPTKEYFKLKEGIHEIDNEAFFVVTDAYEVFGGE